MSPGMVTVSGALMAFVFAYLAVNVEHGSTHGAVLKFLNMTLTYIMILVTAFLALQVGNHTYLGSTILSSFTNVYGLIVVFLFFFLLWHTYWALIEERKNTDPGGS